MKKIVSMLLAGLLSVSLTACGNQAQSETAQAQSETASTDEYLAQLEGTYVELFPELAKEEYHDTWVSYVEPLVGEEATEATIDSLLNMCMAGIYGEEAVEAYQNPEDMRFDCYFIGGVDQFTVAGNVISGTDENGKEVFSHTYTAVENAEDTGFLYYKTEDEHAGQFTYFAFAPDTPESTYHIEFRYAESLEDLQSWYEGTYAYWNAAGILENYDDEMMDHCIELFATENLSGEE